MVSPDHVDEAKQSQDEKEPAPGDAAYETAPVDALRLADALLDRGQAEAVFLDYTVEAKRYLGKGTS